MCIPLARSNPSSYLVGPGLFTEQASFYQLPMGACVPVLTQTFAPFQKAFPNEVGDRSPAMCTVTVSQNPSCLPIFLHRSQTSYSLGKNSLGPTKVTQKVLKSEVLRSPAQRGRWLPHAAHIPLQTADSSLSDTRYQGLEALVGIRPSLRPPVIPGAYMSARGQYCGPP